MADADDQSFWLDAMDQYIQSKEYTALLSKYTEEHCDSFVDVKSGEHSIDQNAVYTVSVRFARIRCMAVSLHPLHMARFTRRLSKLNLSRNTMEWFSLGYVLCLVAVLAANRWLVLSRHSSASFTPAFACPPPGLRELEGKAARGAAFRMGVEH